MTEPARERSAGPLLSALLISALVGTLVGYGILQLRGSGSPRKAAPSVPLPVAARDARSDPAAVWLFGVDTIRFGRDLTSPARLGQQGFGATQGGSAAVYLYEPTEGRVGVVSARTNSIDDLAHVSVQQPTAATTRPILAVTSHAVWVVTGPASVTRVDLASHATRAVALPVAGTVRIATLDDSVLAVVETITGDRVVPVHDDGSVGEARDLPALGTLVTLAPGSHDLWLVASGAALAVDATGRPGTSVRYPGARARDAVVLKGSLWALDDATGMLVRIDIPDGRISARVALGPSGHGPLAPLTGLAAGFGNVYALAATGPGVGGARLTEVDGTGGATRAVFELPARLEAGAIAISD